ncbi:MAG: class I SAM-dependent methyltransferase [Phycisphaerae bacterium]
MTFYDEIAEQYEDITHQQARQASADALGQKLVGESGIRSAVDAACGTGLFTFALAREGAQVVGADLSESMLDKARAAAGPLAGNVRWVRSPMQSLGEKLAGPFDAVLCMGNSLPHLLSDDELDETLAGFAALLPSGGLVVLHLLNYTRVIKQRERIVGIDRNETREFVRFYDFADEMVRFNVLEIDWSTTPPSHEIHSTMLYPWRQAELADALAAAGFECLRSFADLSLSEPFDEMDSDVLVMTAGRAG